MLRIKISGNPVMERLERRAICLEEEMKSNMVPYAKSVLETVQVGSGKLLRNK